MDDKLTPTDNMDHYLFMENLVDDIELDECMERFILTFS